MKVALAYVEYDKLIEPHIDPPMGLLILAQILRDRGHDVRVFSGTKRELKKDLRGFDCVGLSFNTPTALDAYEVANSLGCRKIAGGAHVAALPEEGLEHFDAVVVGEGEYAVVEAVEGVDGILCPPVPSGFVMPAWDLNPFEPTRSIGGERTIMIETSRGCPFRCRFCNSSVLSRKLRFKPIEMLREELEWLKGMGYGAVKVTDDNFNVNKQRAFEVCDLFAEMGFKYRVFCHVRGLDDEIAKHMKETGCVGIAIGVESCDDEMLRRMNKPQRYEDIVRGLEAAHRAGLKTRIYILVGFPGETEESVQTTIERLRRLPFDSMLVFACIPFPGTDLYAHPERYGITWISRDWSQYAQIYGHFESHYTMRTEGFTPEDVRRWRDMLITELSDKKKACIEEREL